MGFVLSVLYFVTNYLTPTTLFGPLAPFRIELILAVLALFVSVPALIKSFILKTPQSLALIGLALAVVLSMLIGMRWPGGAVQEILVFIPNAFAYLLVCLHCKTRTHLQILVLMLLVVCLFVIGNGYFDLLREIPRSGPPLAESTGGVNRQLWNFEHPYLLPMLNSAGEWIYRLRGLGEINDPNDFAQLIVCVIPLVFIFWRKKRMFRNFAFVILPVCALLFGMFLTHSRGALVALMAVAVVSAWRRIGALPSLFVAGAVFIAASALNFTGGREISANAGSDRMALWGDGLGLLKAHPFFGVGFGQMSDKVGQTAHNSIVVCAAELGFFGLYFWTMFLLPTVRDAMVIASPAKVAEAEPIIVESGLFPQAPTSADAIDKAEINRLGRLLVLSLTGLLVAAWFLSRAFVLTLFLLGGMVEVVYQMALQRGMTAPRLRLARVLPYAGVFSVVLVLLMYIMVRILNVMH
ncbi:MAG: O-antigen ligase family protein [Terracidiphilus sp.]